MLRNSITEILTGLAKVSHPITSAMTLPPACYTDADWLRYEQEVVFGKSWVSVGREERWQNPGDYVALDLAGTPVIILRDDKGVLRAWSNSCRHRGMKLLSGEGQCKAVVCPFHGWSYGLDGHLVSAPRMENCADFDQAEFGLLEFRLGSKDGFVFVCLDQEQQPLEDWLGDFGEVHFPWALDQLVATRFREFEVDCNWKAFIEVFNEYYHLPYVHPDSITSFYREPDSTDAVMGEYTTQFGVTEGTAALLEDSKDYALPPGPGLKDRELAGTRYTWVYPNMTFAACFDSLWMYQAYPLGTDKCQVVQTVGFPKASIEVTDFEQRAQAYYQRIDLALAEDLPFLEEQQVGLSSPFARQGRFSALEPSVGNFACWYAEVMRHAVP